MNKNCLLLLLVSTFVVLNLNAQQRGEIIFSEKVTTLDRESILEIYQNWTLPEALAPVSFSVEIHYLEYWTIDAKGMDLIPASGLLTIPISNGCAAPLLHYSHGTLQYDQEISSFSSNFSQHYFGVPFAAGDYVTSIPDYLGYGATPSGYPHPYIHAKSAATTGVDMLRASKDFLSDFGIQWNEQLFLVGYSQGGHTTMALQRELEAFHGDEFNITASSAGSGVYDLSGIMLDSMLLSNDFSEPFLLSFGIVSYQFIYGNIYEQLSDVFMAPYDTMIAQIFNREEPITHFRDSLPNRGADMLQPDFLAAVLSDESHPLNIALRENDVYDWVPVGPLRLYYCEGDDEIPFGNSLFALEHMQAQGAEEVTAISAGQNFDHGLCTYPTIIMTKFWFDELVDGCSVPVAEAPDSKEVFIFPNPFETHIFFDASGSLPYTFEQLNVYDAMGRRVLSKNINELTEIRLPGYGLPAGSYIFELNGKAGTVRKKMVKI